MKKFINFTTLLSFIISLLPFGVYFNYYSQMPNQVAIHRNIDGVADRFTSKSSYEILILCGLGLLGLLFMKILKLVIGKLSKLNETENNNTAITNHVMDIVTLVVTIVFSSTSVYFLITFTPSYKYNSLDIFEISNVFLGVLYMFIGNYLPKFRQNIFSGFRTPATLSNENVWFHTQRFASKVWIISGAVTILVSVFLGHISLIFSLSLTIIFPSFMVLLPFIYSYKVRGKASI